MNRGLASPFSGLVSWLIFAVVILSLGSCANGSKEIANGPGNTPLTAWIGMSVYELKQIYPDLVASDTSKDRFVRNTTEFGLNGSWTYSFTNQKLHWFVFNASQTVINDANFTTCLNATTNIINDYKEVLGQPQRFRVGIPSFNDPEIKPHNGYLVEQAIWEAPVGRIKVDFSFLGENKAYEFLVSLQVSN